MRFLVSLHTYLHYSDISQHSVQLFQGMQCITVLQQTSVKALESSCQCETCHVQFAVQSFPQQEKAATDRRLMQQPRYGHCGAESGAVALPVESKHALLYVLCLSDYV